LNSFSESVRVARCHPCSASGRTSDFELMHNPVWRTILTHSRRATCAVRPRVPVNNSQPLLAS
jgi:hypothetical protein